jgi:hypothetical protein
MSGGLGASAAKDADGEKVRERESPKRPLLEKEFR